MCKRLIALWAILLHVPAFSTELLMVQDEACFWCEAWENEIGAIYPKTAEGKFAPLSRIDLANSLNDERLADRIIFTPTFILIKENEEVARIEGYPGAAFFWTLLEEALTNNTGFMDQEN